MGRILTWLCALLALALPSLAQADPADIDAAARGVVRVVIIGTDGEEVFPVSHGSGFAVAADRIVTNAHVVRDAMRDDSLRIGIVPSDGAEATYGTVQAVSARNDLALIRITGELRLPPLTLAAGPMSDSGVSYSVGYPMNVDRAQGLEIGEVFESQPPVKARGFLAGSRPSRSFDTLLHTAPIARGNSGGPLLDGCGRVLGVNSFGADSGGSDAEFFFAVSNRELLPFLRDNGVTPRSNDTACRSLADLDADERARAEREQMAARADLASRSEAERARRERAQFEAEMRVMAERDDRLFLAVILLLVAAGLAWWAFEYRDVEEVDGEVLLWPKKNRFIMLGAGALAVLAIILQVTRPGIDEIDRRVATAMGEDIAPDGTPVTDTQPGEIRLTCTIDRQRSRITSADATDVTFSWTPQGCVNGQTQYGFSGGTWSRVLAPNDEQAVSVNSFDPDRRVFRIERYLLSRGAMRAAREARSQYTAPACDAQDASTRLGEMQRGVLAGLPSRPNERLVYSCERVER